MDILTEIETSDTDILINIPLTIDSIDGILCIEYDSEDKKWNLKFIYDTFSSYGVELELDSVLEFYEKLEELHKSKLFGNILLNEKVYKSTVTIYDEVYKYLHLEKPSCCVCMEDTQGYKSPCVHDICYRCLLKTLEKFDGSSQLKFKCPICRREFCETDNGILEITNQTQSS